MKNIKKQFKEIQQDLDTTLGIIDTLRDKVNDLEKELKNDAPRPMMYSKNGVGYEISSYHIESNDYVTFKLCGDFNERVYRFRNRRLYDDEYVYPSRKTISLISKVHSFEYFDESRDKWFDVTNRVDRIELLEGVDHYDSLR